MGRGGRHKWRAYDSVLKASPGPASGKCVLAPVCNLMHIVDMKATVDYINNRISKDGHTSRSLLQADAVLTSCIDGQWRAQAYVVLRTAAGVIPHIFNGPYFLAPGSNYTMTVVNNEPENACNRVCMHTDRPSFSSEESIRNAILCVAPLVNENVDPLSLAFKDAVSSRLVMFMRHHVKDQSTGQRDTLAGSSSNSSDTETDSGYSSPASPRPPVMRMPPLPLQKPPRPPPFEKPRFITIEDLLQSAFATHFVDSKGFGRPVSPLAPPNHAEYQPLVFCSVMSSLQVEC